MQTSGRPLSRLAKAGYVAFTVVLSIPRDTLVYEPGCRARRSVGTGIMGPYQSAIIDGAMNIGGPSCAVSTVRDLTGITLDHFVMFNFNSFRAMVDTIGGVEVCVPRSGYHDPYSGLNLSGGRHLLTCNQALAYMRTRHGLQAEGDVGGDLPRIELQQAFMSSVIQKVNSQGVLGNSVELLRIADVATRALTRLGFDVTGTGDAAAASATTVTYSGTAQADSAYTLTTALRAAPAAQNLLAEPAPQTGRPGPVTLIIGSDFAGVNAPSARQHGSGGKGPPGRSAPSAAAQTAVQSRNAGASICSGLPAANPSPGVP